MFAKIKELSKKEFMAVNNIDDKYSLVKIEKILDEPLNSSLTRFHFKIQTDNVEVKNDIKEKYGLKRDLINSIEKDIYTYDCSEDEQLIGWNIMNDNFWYGNKQYKNYQRLVTSNYKNWKYTIYQLEKKYEQQSNKVANNDNNNNNNNALETMENSMKDIIKELNNVNSYLITHLQIEKRKKTGLEREENVKLQEENVKLQEENVKLQEENIKLHHEIEIIENDKKDKFEKYSELKTLISEKTSNKINTANFQLQNKYQILNEFYFGNTNSFEYIYLLVSNNILFTKYWDSSLEKELLNALIDVNYDSKISDIIKNSAKLDYDQELKIIDILSKIYDFLNLHERKKSLFSNIATAEDITDEDITDEDITTEDITTEDVTADDVTDEDITDEDITTEDITDEDITDEDITDEDATAEDIATEDITDEDVTAEDIATEDITTEGATAEDITTEDATAEDITDEDATAEENKFLIELKLIVKLYKELEDTDLNLTTNALRAKLMAPHIYDQPPIKLKIENLINSFEDNNTLIYLYKVLNGSFQVTSTLKEASENKLINLLLEEDLSEEVLAILTQITNLEECIKWITRRKNAKKINLLKIAKLLFYFILLYIILFKTALIFKVILDSINYIIALYIKFGALKASVIIFQFIFIIIIITKLLKVTLGKKYNRYKLQHHAKIYKNTYSHGNARFQTIKEMKKNFVVVEYGKHRTDGFIVAQYKQYKLFGIKKIYFPHFQANPNAGFGSELNNTQQIKVLKDAMVTKISDKEKWVAKVSAKPKNIIFIDENPVHKLLVAATRAGKTQTDVIPQIDYLTSIREEKNKPHLVITDPKGELFENTSKNAKKRGYEILVVNMKDFSKSHSYNPLKFISMIMLTAFEKDEYGKNREFNYKKVNSKIIKLIKEDIYTNQLELDFEKIQDLLENKNLKGLISYISKVRIDTEKEVGTISKTPPTVDLRKFINKLEKIYLDELQKHSFASGETEIDKFSTVLIPPSEGESAKWDNGARDILCAYIKYTWEQSFIYNTLEDTFNLYSVYVEVNKGGENIGNSNAVKTRFQEKLSLRDKAHYASLKHGPTFSDNPYDSHISTLKVALSIFSNENLGKLLSKDQINMDRITNGEKPYAIYLITPDYDRTYGFIPSSFISQLYIMAVQSAEKTGGKLNRKIKFIMEEFTNTPAIAELTPKITVCLGRGIQFEFIIQNTEQLTQVYGESEAKSLLSNTHNKSFLLAGDEETREWFSLQMGEKTELNYSYSGKENDETTVSISEQGVRLVTPYDLNLNPMGQVYSLNTRQHPIKANLRPAFQYIKDSKITEEEFFDMKENFNLHDGLLKEDIILCTENNYLQEV